MKIIPEFQNEQFEEQFETSEPSKKLNINLNQSKCTILVIDDDASLQRLIQQTLASGANVLQEFDGNSEYVESLDFEGVDAIILDYKMPQEDGLSILKKIRSKYTELPILFMTGFGDLEIAKEAIQSGANEYFPKPFNQNDLREVIAKWIPGFDEGRSQNYQVAKGGELSPLQNLAEIENYLTAKDYKGVEFKGRVVRYNSRSIVVETPHDLHFQLGTALNDTTITLGHRSMEVAAAFILHISELAGRQILEISLPGVWQIEGFEEGTDPEDVAKIIRSREKSPVPIYSRFDRGIVERKVLPDSFRAAVSDVEHILQDFYDDLEQFEKFLYQVGSDERAELEKRMIEYAEGRFFPALNQATARFEEVAALAKEEGVLSEFGRYAQKRLFPLMLCSPFINRVVTKPIGIPGDFGILGRILGHPYDGHSLYSRMLNAWILSTNPSIAYRHRIKLLEEAINEAVAKASREGRRAKILSMASGVAYEVQRFVTSPTQNPKVDFELVDFSNRTLFEAKRLFTTCQKFNDPSEVAITLRHGSVIDLAKQSRKSRSEGAGSYDLVYCAGLFDYLSGRMCSSIVSYLYDMARKGGKVIVSNYTPENSNRYFMGVLLEWELIYRSRDEFEALMKTTSAKDSFSLVEDETRSEVYAIAEKI